ncbi:MAG TPA: peptidoglycan-associated lipoprotein [Bacteroidales bacterium]|nr:peptidoglycan-associated lipoprotein [Bacteroidales bacterium]
MRILTIGSIVFVIWAFFSTWLFVDFLKPALKRPVPVETLPETRSIVADSLAKIYALMPKELIIWYDFDKAGLTPDTPMEASLTAFKEWLDKYPGSMLVITGHTDLVGTPEYNQALGMERARAAQKFLESKGFPPARMIVSSKGEEEPITGYITDDERAKNRRTVISIKK